jgi:hypothetical protein
MHTEISLPECSRLYITKIYSPISYNFLYVLSFNDTVSSWKFVVCNSRSISAYWEIKDRVLICGTIQ